MLKQLSFLTPAIAFVFLAGVVSSQSTVEYACSEETPVLIASKTQGCQCTKTDEVIPADSGFTKCSVAEGADPKIQMATCQQAEGSQEGKCAQKCVDTAEMRGGKCVTMNTGIPPPAVYKKRSECEATGRFPILVYQNREPSIDGCLCVNSGSPKLTDGSYTKCPANPTNGEIACMTYGGRGAGKCAIVCNKNFKLNVEEIGCVKDEPPPTYSGGGGGGGGTGAEAFAPPCPSGSVTFSRPSGACGCAPDQDIVDEVGGITCPPSPAHGKIKCKGTSSSSSCVVQCDAGFKLDAAGENCVVDVAQTDKTFTAGKCVDNPPGKFLLVASPGLGCVCRSESDALAANETVCKKPPGGGKISCFQSADLSVAECRATNCPAGKKAEGADCVPAKLTKLTSDCDPEYLLAAPTGCICGKVTATTRSYICFPGDSGPGKCESNLDNTEATCVD